MKMPSKYTDKPIRFYKAEATKSFLKVVFMLAVMLGCRQAFATDLLDNTTTDITDTLNGSGRLWFILVDALLGIVAYIRTKNLLAFIGVFAISVFLSNVLPSFL